MTIELSNYVKKNLTHDQITYIIAGERKADELGVMVSEGLGVGDHIIVEAKRQIMIQGRPGVGKSFKTKQTCENLGIQAIEIGTGSSLSLIAGKLAYANYWTSASQEIAVIWDDADDVVFGEKKDSNIWKRVFTDDGDEPTFNHNVNLTKELKSLENSGKLKMVQAMKAHMPEDETGITVPMTRFRHLFLTNTDYELECEKKSKSWMSPIVDRFNVNRLDYDDNTAWGWLSFTLLTSQPFEQRYGICLDEIQKVAIIRWLSDKQDKIGNKLTYRTVKEMAQYIINEPNNYLNRWEKFIRK
jgi:hypothetical protein